MNGLAPGGLTPDEAMSAAAAQSVEPSALSRMSLIVATATCFATFLYFIDRTAIRVPVFDMLDWLQFYDDRLRANDWLGYLWTPDNGRIAPRPRYSCHSAGWARSSCTTCSDVISVRFLVNIARRAASRHPAGRKRLDLLYGRFLPSLNSTPLSLARCSQPRVAGFRDALFVSDGSAPPRRGR